MGTTTAEDNTQIDFEMVTSNAVGCEISQNLICCFRVRGFTPRYDGMHRQRSVSVRECSEAPTAWCRQPERMGCLNFESVHLDAGGEIPF